MQKAFITAILATLFLLQTACSFPGVYRIDVQQGNIVDKEDLEGLSPTMTRTDVHDQLGSPITTSTFNPDREHYIYTFQENGGEIKRQQITVYYEDNRYLRHTADLLDETPAN